MIARYWASSFYPIHETQIHLIVIPLGHSLSLNIAQNERVVELTLRPLAIGVRRLRIDSQALPVGTQLFSISHLVQISPHDDKLALSHSVEIELVCELAHCSVSHAYSTPLFRAGPIDAPSSPCSSGGCMPVSGWLQHEFVHSDGNVIFKSYFQISRHPLPHLARRSSLHDELALRREREHGEGAMQRVCVYGSLPLGTKRDSN